MKCKSSVKIVGLTATPIQNERINIALVERFRLLVHDIKIQLENKRSYMSQVTRNHLDALSPGVGEVKLQDYKGERLHLQHLFVPVTPQHLLMLLFLYLS